VIITDEMLKLAEAAYDNNIDDLTDACDLDSMRLALEAVAPMLIAQGMVDAAFMAYCDGHTPTGDRIRARAQEIDPQPELRGQSFEEPYP